MTKGETTAIRIYYPQYWTEDTGYGVNELRILLERFQVPLLTAGVGGKELFIEWRRCKSFARRQMAEFLKDVKILWHKILTFKRLEFPHVCLVIELLM